MLSSCYIENINDWSRHGENKFKKSSKLFYSVLHNIKSNFMWIRIIICRKALQDESQLKKIVLKRSSLSKKIWDTNIML